MPEIVAFSPKLPNILVLLRMLSIILPQGIIKFLDKLAISYLIARVAMGLRVIEVHQSLKIHPKLILSDHHLSKGTPEGCSEGGWASCIIKNHNYYLMMMRQALRTSQQLLLPLRFTYANPFFTRSSETQTKQGHSEKGQARQQQKDALAALVAKINDANKYFLGVKLNTNYLKVNKTVTYDQVAKLTVDKATVTDIPIEISKKEADNASFEKVNQEAALNQKSGQVAFSRCRLEPVLAQMQRMVQQFMVGVGKKTRLSKVQPNFEIQIIKTLNSLEQKIQFRLSNEDALPEIKIQSITLLKGLTAYRNDNYSTDSFDKNEEELADGIVTYKLYRQQKEEYPEVEWFSTKRINARFELLVRGGPSITILDSGNDLGSTSNAIHSVVIEADLVPPPPNAEHQLTPEQFIRSYRLDINSLLLTNFDRKNQFYPLTYSEQEKKTTLVNRIL